jgi:glutamate transport system permease protein
VEVLIDNRGEILEGFLVTLRLFGLAAVGSLILGTILATLRVSPVPVLRLVGASYVNTVRNTPLVLVFALIVFGMPTLGLRVSFFLFAAAALTIYTSAFVCEALRSGINAVDPGQAEAARAIGLTFRQNLGLVVLPQASRAVIQPVANVLIALIRNTAIAEAFGVVEVAFVLEDKLREFPGALYPLFIGIAGLYMAVVAVIATVARTLERRLQVVR